MKKFVLPVFILFIVVACAKKVVPTATNLRDGDKGTQKPVEPNKPDEKSISPTQPWENIPLAPNKPSEDQMGSTVFLSKCTKCHVARIVNAYTYPQWEVILKKMVPNAKLSADEETLVVAYIRANSKK